MKKGQISFKKFVKITKVKYRISLKNLRFAQICPKQALKYTIFVNIQKRPKNGQMAKPFYFWQMVSKKAKWQPRNLPLFAGP